MPEREQLIAQWRRTLAETAGLGDEVLDELESHLRDEIQQLMSGGVAMEEAFTQAASRLGQPQSLATEFAKVAETVNWLPVRIVTFAAIALSALLVGFLLTRYQEGRVELLLVAHVCAITTGYGASLLVGALAICYVITSLFRELNAGQLQALERTAFRLTAAAVVLTLTGILLGCVWAKEHLGRYWGWDPKETWAVGVFVWDLALLLLMTSPAWKQRALLLGIAGNGVVGFAWLAGVPHLFTAKMVFGLTHLLLLGMGFLPRRQLRRRKV
jgi:hypothetical protein